MKVNFAGFHSLGFILSLPLDLLRFGVTEVSGRKGIGKIKQCLVLSDLSLEGTWISVG